MRSLWFIFVIGLSLSHQIHNIPYNYHWYGTAQFKLDINTRVTREISRATREFHTSKSLKYIFTRVSL